MTETALERKRPMRRSLFKLLSGQVDRYSFQHLSGEPLVRFFNGINALGVEQLQEDRDAAASVSGVEWPEALERTLPDEDPE